jgi:hypothetical protein
MLTVDEDRAAEARPNPLVATARVTGLLYLGVAVTGLLGFIVVRPRLFDPDDPAATLANLLADESLARAGIALELGIVLTQTLAALWFYRLFRTVDGFAAGAIACFGLVNAVAVLGSAAFLATALQVALDPVGDTSGLPQFAYLVSDNLWGVGALFFGLWLIPMGWCVLRSGWMPRLLGWTLVVGGVGYVLSAFVRYLVPDAGGTVDLLLAAPASVGEFWMVGYLLVRGVRADAVPDARAATA